MLRRKFIVRSILAVGGTVAGIYLYRSTVQNPAELAISEIASKLAELPGAVRFGEIFRKQLQKNGHAMKSLRRISSDLTDAHGDLRPDNVGNVLEQQIQTELRTNQVHVVDGWYLTKTELDLCALASVNRET